MGVAAVPAGMVDAAAVRVEVPEDVAAAPAETADAAVRVGTADAELCSMETTGIRGRTDFFWAY